MLQYVLMDLLGCNVLLEAELFFFFFSVLGLSGCALW